MTNKATVFGWHSPWSGIESDPVPWTYLVWSWAYRSTRRLRHRLGIHDWHLICIDADRFRRCTWCGKRNHNGER